MSGLLAATELKAAGFRVCVFEKARGVGGRMATRRSALGVFDHGAQYFTARDPEFCRRVRDWSRLGLLRRWASGFALAKGGFKQDGEPRWCGTHGMNSVAKHLATSLDVQTLHKSQKVQHQNGRWVVEFDGGATAHGTALLLTPPVPQSLALLDAGKINLPSEIRNDLEAIHYAPSLALLIQLDGSSRIPPPGGLWTSGEPIAWMSDNSQKGIANPGRASVTLHAGPNFTREHWSKSDTWVGEQLIQAALPWLGDRILSTQVHRWRYSMPEHIHPDRCAVLEQPGPLVFAGDAFSGPRVEGAALSGLAAAGELLRLLTPSMP